MPFPWYEGILNILTIGAYGNIRTLHQRKEMEKQIEDTYAQHPEMTRIHPVESSRPFPVLRPPPGCVLA